MGKLDWETKTLERIARDEERAQAMYARFSEGHTLAEVGTVFGLTRERVRQILAARYGNDYKAQLEKNGSERKVTVRTCMRCGCEFGSFRNKAKARKYCSEKCRFIRTVKYPEWVGDRKLDESNFTKEEWRQIRNIMHRSWYSRHKASVTKRMSDRRRDGSDFKTRERIYLKRWAERRKFGKAITPIPIPRRPETTKP